MAASGVVPAKLTTKSCPTFSASVCGGFGEDASASSGIPPRVIPASPIPAPRNVRRLTLMDTPPRAAYTRRRSGGVVDLSAQHLLRLEPREDIAHQSPTIHDHRRGHGHDAEPARCLCLLHRVDADSMNTGISLECIENTRLRLTGGAMRAEEVQDGCRAA